MPTSLQLTTVGLSARQRQLCSTKPKCTRQSQRCSSLYLRRRRSCWRRMSCCTWCAAVQRPISCRQLAARVGAEHLHHRPCPACLLAMMAHGPPHPAPGYNVSSLYPTAAAVAPPNLPGCNSMLTFAGCCAEEGPAEAAQRQAAAHPHPTPHLHHGQRGGLPVCQGPQRSVTPVRSLLLVLLLLQERLALC